MLILPIRPPNHVTGDAEQARARAGHLTVRVNRPTDGVDELSRRADELGHRVDELTGDADELLVGG